jgi:hypothetical protein
VAKAKTPDNAKLIEGLLNAVGGQPMRQTADKTAPGIFPAGATGKKLAQHAIDMGYLEPCDGPPPPATKRPAKPKVIPHARITARGREWVLQQTTPRQALEGLLAAFQQQADVYKNRDGELGVLQAQLADLHNSFTQVQQQVRDASARRQSETQQLVQTIETVAAVVRQALAAGGASPAAHPPVPPQDLGPELLAYVRSWQQQRGADCPLPDLFRHLKERQPGLSIGAFHDTVRVLYRDRRLELTPWSGTLDNLREPELALFISSTVMYYAHVPSQHR